MVENIAGMVPPKHDLGEDTAVWGLEGNGEYSVKSGYLLINDLITNDGVEDRVWKYIWNWPGPNKIRHFMWLVSHNRLMTNKERKRRHLADSEVCSVCLNREESIDHILRGCPVAFEVWRGLCTGGQLNSFLSMNFDSWWKENLNKPNWNMVFGTACWILWRSRNERVFQQANPTATAIISQVNLWNQYIISAQIKAAQTRSLQPTVRETWNIAWQPAADPWITLNTDGARTAQGSAAAGGALRTANGDVVAAFTMNMGRCSITRAEIRGIVEGMRLAWNKGVRKLAIQTDSKCAVQLLQKIGNNDHQHAALIIAYEELTRREWDVTLHHIYRESNFLADSLAAKGHSLSFGTHSVETSDPAVARWCAYDRLRSSQPRLVLHPL
ncbi:Putative ribonuclease H protein At1g65750 [Linum perenne]